SSLNKVAINRGATNASAYLDVLGTTEQMRLLYDSSNYFSTTVGSTGSTNFTLTGTDPKFYINNSIEMPGELGIRIGNSIIDGNASLQVGHLSSSSKNGILIVGNHDGGVPFMISNYANSEVLRIQGDGGVIAHSYVIIRDAPAPPGIGLTVQPSGAPYSAVNVFAVEGQTASIVQYKNFISGVMSEVSATGKFGYGTNGTVSAPFHAISTTEQMRLGYDASNYISVTVDSVGSTNFSLTGTSPTFSFSNNVGVSCSNPDHLLEIGGTGTGCNTGAGSYLNAAGDTTFTANSSRIWKQNITTVEKENILDLIASTPVRRYDWKPEYCDGPQCLNKIGFIAEEFYPVLEHGDDKHVNGQDVSMAEWLGLQKLIQVTNTMNLTIQPLTSLDVETTGSLGYLIKTFLANSENTISDLYAKIIHTDKVETKELCVGATCITETQFLEMVNQNGGLNSNPPIPEPTPEPTPEPEPQP
ncbi:MAG: tail fiber domain-containing protein, partial [Minisyncoccia bacterium]